MKKRFQVLGLLIIWVSGAVAQKSSPTAPRVFLMDAARLAALKQAVAAKDKSYDAMMVSIDQDAKKLLAGGVFSVTTKEITPPSGDKHDYMSQAPYFWPDPSKKDGLPYIRKDGERNPEISKITDHKSMDQMTDAVETLGLAYYLRGDEAYATKAVQVLSAFFLDPATRMNPNLEYGQGIPGITKGRGIGLIETTQLTRVVDAIGLLEGSRALTSADEKGLKDWFGKFLDWMQTSKNGTDEAAAKNNHGTHYDSQVASYALFVGKPEIAKSILETAKQKRIAGQIEPDGRMPLELERTNAWGYSTFNLRAMMNLATLGTRVGVDLWNFETKDGRSIRKAVEFLYPFAIGEKWTYQEINGFKPDPFYPEMRTASEFFTDEKFRAMMARIPASNAGSRDILFNR
ncbi:MAG: alginate lyase family protein [Acidobacteriota bacterium]